MSIVLMQTKTDCEVAAVATATETTYDKAKKALSWRDLPGGAENPVYGNPWNLYRALLNLGYWKRNVTLTDLLTGNFTPMKTIVLVHDPDDPLFSQHWTVHAGISQAGNHLLLWGDNIVPRIVSPAKLKIYFKRGWPNCAFEVYKASIWRLIFQRLLSLFKKEA
jgi:hypothetical protein